LRIWRWSLLARRLSKRGIADVFTDGAGRPLLGRAAVSQLSERLWTEYQAFAQRDLAEHNIIYLFVDGVAERLGPVSRASRCSPPADRPR
jgi:putative transposase